MPISFILELSRRAAPSSDARSCCLPLSSAMYTIALALAPLSALACVPLAPRPSPPPSTTTAIATVDDHHRHCRTFEDDDCQKPAVTLSSSTAAMAVIVECGGGRWLWRRWLLCRRCQRRQSAPSAPSHRRLHRQRPSWTKTTIAADDIDCRRIRR